MPAKSNEDRVAREVADTLVKDDGVELGRAKEAVTFVLQHEKVKATDALQIYRAARRQLHMDETEEQAEENDLDVDDDARPTLVAPPKQKPSRKGTRKDTPTAKKDTRK
jgi:hypothetical protein